MTEKTADQIAKDLAAQYKKEGEEVDKAVESDRKDVEKYYAEQRKADEEKERQLKLYQDGVAIPEKAPEQQAVDTANAEPGEAPSGTPAAAQQEKAAKKSASKSD